MEAAAAVSRVELGGTEARVMAAQERAAARPGLAQGIEESSRDGDYNIFLCNTDESAARQEEVLDSLVGRVDAIILATGYRPSVGYLRELGALDDRERPVHEGGISTTHLGLVFVGLEYQRSYASNTLRGVGDDARAVMAPMVAWIRDASTTIGLTP